MGLLFKILRSLFGASKPSRGRTYQRPYEAPAQKFPRPTRTVTTTVIVAEIAIASTLKGRCYVVDGDTITIGDTNIRLAGIDAPEMDHPYGKNAKWALVNLCKGQVITAEMEDHFTHGRNVATCYLPDGRDLSAEMVKLGLAIDWRKYSGGKYRPLEPEGIWRKLWRADARQKGLMPPLVQNG